MNAFKIIITSRNNIRINNYLLLLAKNKINSSNILEKFFLKKRKKKLTILKSPHVNKAAQEQFENKHLKKQFKVQAIEKLNYVIFLKKLNFNLYPDISAKVKYKINNADTKKIKVKIFSPNNFKFNKCYNNISQKFNFITVKQLKNKSKKLMTKVNKYIQAIDIYGELFKNV